MVMCMIDSLWMMVASSILIIYLELLDTHILYTILFYAL